ncbi:transcriptional regulator [Streptacidiphilus sp. 4-A2]|nr:transcriptional regulator [Streptacidiphilus sp. 4-A2]
MPGLRARSWRCSRGERLLLHPPGAGQSLNASPQVLDAVAGALRLDEAERVHLHELARSAARSDRARRPPPERLTPAARQLLEALADVPAVVIGRRSDVLAWNPLGTRCSPGTWSPAARIHRRTVPTWPGWYSSTHTPASCTRTGRQSPGSGGQSASVAGQYPQDAALHTLVGELSARSSDFASMWADHRVKPCTVAEYEMRHPLVGPLTVTQQTLSHGPGPGIVVATAQADSPSRAALTLLAQAVRHTTGPGAPVRPQVRAASD